MVAQLSFDEIAVSEMTFLELVTAELRLWFILHKRYLAYVGLWLQLGFWLRLRFGEHGSPHILTGFRGLGVLGRNSFQKGDVFFLLSIFRATQGHRHFVDRLTMPLGRDLILHLGLMG